MRLSFRTALLWSAASGFLALAWEIVWARVFNFVSGSSAPVFGYMLGCYLTGLAAGACLSKGWHRISPSEDSPQGMLILAKFVLIANLGSFLVAPLTALLAVSGDWDSGLVLVALSGLTMGIVFPLLCHLAVESDARAGGRLSWIYLVNILGSGAGSLLTGFMFMEWMSLHVLSLLLLAAGWAWAETIASFQLKAGFRSLVVLMCLLTWPVYQSLYERLFYKQKYTSSRHFAEVVESRHGVITVDSGKRVFGNGVYDGVIETHLTPESWLVRPYFFSAVRDKIETVLVIGVSAGAWTQILAHHPQVKQVTAVELSHGYVELISRHPEVSSILTNPKVEVVIDDGRRWLRRNPDRKFDAIVMNTTYHWREHATSLLSKEFLEQVKAHLTPDGVAFWNCTGSARAAKTGMEVFPHTLMVINNCMASNSPLVPDRERWGKVLSQYQIDGQPVVKDSTVLESILQFTGREGLPTKADQWKWTNREHMQQLWGTAEPITDDNLGHEYEPR